MQTTRWSENEKRTLEEVIKAIISYSGDDTKEVGDKNFQFEKAFENNQIIELNYKEIKFNRIKFRYETIVSGIDLTLEERTSQKTGYILVYNNGEDNYIIIDKNSGAETLIRKLLGYKNQRKKINSKMLPLNSDFFIWMINKVYNNENILDDGIEIKTIKGFQGNTEDLLTKVTADGETVMNVISALSFLLESKNLNQTKIELQYNETHYNIELTLKQGKKNPVIEIEPKSYRGELTLKSVDFIDYLLLIVYVELMPKLFQCYKQEISNDEWNSVDGYVNFITEVGKDLSNRINERIKDVKK